MNSSSPLSYSLKITIMRKIKILLMALLIAVIFVSTSCATILGGRRTAYQKTKPLAGQPQRELRWGFLITDILLGCPVCLVVDFATGAIYQPAKK